MAASSVILARRIWQDQVCAAPVVRGKCWVAGMSYVAPSVQGSGNRRTCLPTAWNEPAQQETPATESNMDQMQQVLPGQLLWVSRSQRMFQR